MTDRQETATVATVVSLLAAGLLLLLLGDCRKRAPKPETSGFDSIAEKCKELGSDPDRCAKFVADLPHEEYPGSLRGALGTLWSGAGNALDRAHLLRKMLVRCGLEARIVEGDTFGVEANRDGKWVSMGSAAGSVKRAFEEIPRELQHRLAISLHGKRFEYAVADLVGARISLGYEGANAVLEVGRDRHVVAVPAGARRQELLFEHVAPGGKVRRVKREIWTAEFPGQFPNVFDARNRYAIRVMAGFLGDGVREREGEDFNDRAVLTFLELSDRQARKLARELRVTAFFAGPRIVIAGTEWEGDRRVATLDLRKNDMFAGGDERVAFQLVRTANDQALEGEVLRGLTGQDPVTAAGLLLAHHRGVPASPAARKAFLLENLGRLLREGRPGAKIRVAPEGKDLSVEVVRKEDRLVAREKELREADLPPYLDELDVFFGKSGLPIGYRVDLEFTDAAPSPLFLGARVFESHADKLSFEVQVTQLDPDLRLEVRDYFDEGEKKFFDSPRTGRVRVTGADRRESRVWTHWYQADDQQTGRAFEVPSETMRRELAEQGRTRIRFKKRDGTLTDEIDWILCDRKPVELLVNNRRMTFDAFVVGGDWAKNNPAKKAQGEYPEIKIDDSYVVNRYVFLDDPNFPLVVGSAYDPRPEWPRIHTAFGARVVDEAGRGVGGAEVKILGTSSSARTWGDGRATLPLLDKPLGEFEVEVRAAGYETLKAKVDFRKADALPLRLALKPLPRIADWLWIDRRTAADLAMAKISARAKALISERIEDPNVAAIVPVTEVFSQFETTAAWLEVDVATFEIYGRTEDGLYGSTGRDPFKGGKKVLSYYSGHVAAWYAWAAGAVSSVGRTQDIGEMYKHACRVADEIVAMYESGLGGIGGKIAGQVVAPEEFLKGLRTGVATAKKMYKEAWGVD